MGKAQHEFRSVRLKDRFPLLIAKAFTGGLMVLFSYLLVLGDTISERLQMLSLVLTLTFLYANLAVLKYELSELVQPPIILVGYPMAVLSTIVYFISYFI